MIFKGSEQETNITKYFLSVNEKESKPLLVSRRSPFLVTKIKFKMEREKMNRQKHTLGNQANELKNQNETDFLKDWTNEQTKRVKRLIYRYFTGKNLIDQNGKDNYIYSFSKLENVFGLPFTSSGDFAGVWNTNSEIYIAESSKFTIQGFAMDKSENVIMISSNGENEYKYHVLGNIKTCQVVDISLYTLNK